MCGRLALALLVALSTFACGKEPVPAEALIPDPGAGGFGGAAIVCDRDGDGYDGPHCDGPDCADAIAWIHPGAEEICANETDDDCDGAIDEGCDCVPGDLRGCYPGDPAQRDVGICAAGLQACGDDGLWGPCEGARLPRDEGGTCDYVDQDCDGTADEGLRNACGLCGSPPREICGNGLDDDCDGAIDPPSLCRLSCEGIDATDPQLAFLACCAVDPATGARSDRPVRHSYECVAWEGLPACASPERPCLSLDGRTTCVTACDEEGCVCGVEEEGRVVPSPACGFETPCAYLGCEGRTNQPCYTGPPQTAGVGVCRMGTTSCGADGGWGACEGEVLPGVEICGNGLDDDCDGAVDELCPALAEEQACYRGPPLTRGIGACADGVQKAVKGLWGPCMGDVLLSGEICGDGIDADCNGFGGFGQPEDPGCAPPPACDGAPPDACGGCGEAPCFTATFAEPGRCEVEGRSCVGVGAHAGEPTLLVPIHDKTTEVAFDTFYAIGRPSTAPVSLVLRRFDRITGAMEWEAPIPETQATALAIAPDGSAWIGAGGGLHHFDAGGHRLCTRSFDGPVDALVVDPDGHVWIGATAPPAGGGTGSSRPILYKVHGHAYDGLQPDGAPWPDGIPRCRAIDLAPDDPGAIGIELPTRALSMDITKEEILWLDGWVRLDTRTLAWQQVPVGDMDFFMIDGFGRAYGWGEVEGPLGIQYMRVGRVQANGPYTDPTAYRSDDLIPWYVTSLRVSGEGDLWGLDSDALLRLGPARGPHDDLLPTPHPLAGLGTGTAFSAEDVDRTLWINDRVCSGRQGFARFDPASGSWTKHCDPAHEDLVFTRGRPMLPPWMRSRSRGRWTQIVDALHPGTRWLTLDWEASVPLGASVEAHVSFADTPAAFDAAPRRCGPFREPPVDLRGCGADGHRFARIEIELIGAPDGARPSVSSPTIGWTRP